MTFQFSDSFLPSVYLPQAPKLPHTRPHRSTFTHALPWQSWGQVGSFLASRSQPKGLILREGSNLQPERGSWSDASLLSSCFYHRLWFVIIVYPCFTVVSVFQLCSLQKQRPQPHHLPLCTWCSAQCLAPTGDLTCREWRNTWVALWRSRERGHGPRWAWCREDTRHL